MVESHSSADLPPSATTGCCIVGGGPAGMVLALILARAGVQVTVLEKHHDFLRDFRGDTVHSSTLTLLDELGLGVDFASLGPRYIEQFGVFLDSGRIDIADLGRLPGAHKHIALIPQWDFLDLIADAAASEPSHTLIMGASVTGLLRQDGRVVGVVYRHNGAEITLSADLVVGCDGRTSTVRAVAGLTPREFGVPMDIWWFRLSRRAGDPAGGFGRISRGTMLVMIDRGSYFQLGYLIRKGDDARLRADGVAAFRARIADLVPWLADRVGELNSLDDVKLLSVSANGTPPTRRTPAASRVETTHH